jgi:Protein of unknown function (DUF4232)
VVGRRDTISGKGGERPIPAAISMKSVMPPAPPNTYRPAAEATLGEARARRGWRRPLTLSVVSCTLALILGGSATPSPSLGSTTPRCLTSHLHLSFVRGTAALSHLYWDLALRNVGSATCHLHGYPGVGLLDSHGQLIHVNVDRAAGLPVTTVTVHHGQRAFFTFAYTSSGPCLPHFFSAYGLQIFPPGNTQRLLLHSSRFDICDPSVGGRPHVYPVRRTLNR